MAFTYVNEDSEEMMQKVWKKMSDRVRKTQLQKLF